MLDAAKLAYEAAQLQLQTAAQPDAENTLVQAALDAYLRAQDVRDAASAASAAAQDALTALAMRLIDQNVASANADAQIAQEAVAAADSAIDGADALLELFDTLASPLASDAEKDAARKLLDAAGAATRQDAEDMRAQAVADKASAESALAAAEQARLAAEAERATPEAFLDDYANDELADATASQQNAQSSHQNLPALPAVTQDAIGADYAPVEDGSSDAEEPTIRTGGNLSILSGGSVGLAGDPISTSVDGAIAITGGSSALDGVNLAGQGDMRVEGIAVGGPVSVTANGDLTDASEKGKPTVQSDMRT